MPVDHLSNGKTFSHIFLSYVCKLVVQWALLAGVTIIALPTRFASRVHLQFSRHYGDIYLTACQAFSPAGSPSRIAEKEQQQQTSFSLLHKYVVHVGEEIQMGLQTKLCLNV